MSISQVTIMSREEARERALEKLGEAVRRCREYCRREIASGFERMVVETRAELPSAAMGTRPSLVRVNEFLSRSVSKWADGLPALRGKFAGEFEDLILVVNVELLDLDNASEFEADMSFDLDGPAEPLDDAGFDLRVFWGEVVRDSCGSAHPLVPGLAAPALGGDYKEAVALALADAYLRQPFALHVMMNVSLLWSAAAVIPALSALSFFGGWKEKLVAKVGERLSALPQEMVSTFDSLDENFFGRIEAVLSEAAVALSDGRAAQAVPPAAHAGPTLAADLPPSPLAAVCEARAETLARVSAMTDALAYVARRLGTEDTVEALRRNAGQMRSGTFKLVAFGSHRSGKSTLLNAFVNHPEPHGPLLKPEAEDAFDGVSKLEVCVPAELARHITLTDTLALDETPERTAAVFDNAADADAALVLIRSDALPMIRETGVRRELRDREVKTFWVINRINGRPFDERYQAFLWRRLVHETLGGPERVDGGGFDFAAYDVFCVDAYRAAWGRLNGDASAVEESGIEPLEERLAAFLKGERLKARVSAWLGLALAASADFVEETERRLSATVSEEAALSAKCELTRQLIMESGAPNAESIIPKVLGNWQRALGRHAENRKALDSLRDEIRWLSANAELVGTGAKSTASTASQLTNRRQPTNG